MIQQSGKEKKEIMLTHQKSRNINLNQDANYEDVLRIRVRVGFSKVFTWSLEPGLFIIHLIRTVVHVWRVKRKIIYILVS